MDARDLFGAAGVPSTTMLPSNPLSTAVARLFENPMDRGAHDAFMKAASDQRDVERANGHPEPLGTTYPRTSRSEFSHSEIVSALAFGILRFGRDSIDWARLTTDAFRPEGGVLPAWASMSSCAVFAGPATHVEDWRRATVCDRVEGYVARFDTNLAVPIMSYAYRGQTIIHRTNPNIDVRIDNNGFPVLDPGIDILMPFKQFTMSDSAQFSFCNRLVTERVKRDQGFADTLPADLRAAFAVGVKTNAPAGWVWHHHQDAGRMQLVRKDHHDAVCAWQVKHTGGAAIWGGDHRHRPRDAKTGKERRHIFKTFYTMQPRDRKAAW